MNERIQELAEQAGADFMRRINYNNLEGEEYEEDAGVIFDSNESFKKFAEMIVRECVDIIDPKTGTKWIKDQTQEEFWKNQSVHLIKQHFGVEE